MDIPTWLILGVGMGATVWAGISLYHAFKWARQIDKRNKEWEKYDSV